MTLDLIDLGFSPAPTLPGQRPRVMEVEPEIFLFSFAPDCMSHKCRCRDEGDKLKLDACCQHGADVDLFERDKILRHGAPIAAVLAPELRDRALWFDESAPEVDDDFPSGTAVRSATAGEGCVFLSHRDDARGCALHRAALESGEFTPEEIKPVVCQLYPLAYGGGVLGLSTDFDRYSCASYPDGPTVYRLQRGVIAAVFGDDLVARLDEVERKVLGRRLRVAAAHS